MLFPPIVQAVLFREKALFACEAFLLVLQSSELTARLYYIRVVSVFEDANVDPTQRSG